MSKADVLALPAAVDRFNGFYSESGSFIMMDQMRVLIAELLAAVLVLATLVVAAAKLFAAYRRRRAHVE